MAGISTTGGRWYFVALSSLERLEMQFVPEKLSINRQPSVQQVEIVGANLPKLQHQGGERTLSFELDFYAQDANREDVIKKCLWMESLTYRDGSDKPAEKVRMIAGRLFNKDIWMVKTVQYDLKMFNKKFGYLPSQAYIQVTLVQDGDLEPKARDVKRF